MEPLSRGEDASCSADVMVCLWCVICIVCHERKKSAGGRKFEIVPAGLDHWEAGGKCGGRSTGTQQDTQETNPEPTAGAAVPVQVVLAVTVMT